MAAPGPDASPKARRTRPGPASWVGPSRGVVGCQLRAVPRAWAPAVDVGVSHWIEHIDRMGQGVDAVE